MATNYLQKISSETNRIERLLTELNEQNLILIFTIILSKSKKKVYPISLRGIKYF